MNGEDVKKIILDEMEKQNVRNCDLAKAIGVDRHVIWTWKHDVNCPNLTNADKALKVLNKSVTLGVTND